MTKRQDPLFDYESYTLDMETMFDECAGELLTEAGGNSFKRPVQQHPDILQMTGANIRRFQDIWPHLCCVRRNRRDMTLLDWPTEWIRGSLMLRQCTSYACAHDREWEFGYVRESVYG